MTTMTSLRNAVDAEEWAMRCDLAAAFRLSARMGLNVGIGNHFSLMMPGSDDRFLVNARGLLFQEITASNLLVVDFDGRVISGGREVRAVTYHIHAPIHRAAPAAKCVVHLHPPNLTTLSMIEGGRLALAHHDNLLLNHRVAYDDAATGPASNLEEGYRLVAALGDKTVMVMANHGVLSVGPTVHDAFHEMLVAEKVCGWQLQAQATGLKLRQQPEHLRWDNTGVWSERVDARLFLDAWRRILDREEPDYAT
jgi:ribulose-5-phosphate 4-epimerase/fuculose-1-phosphate aldolase